jgi:MFS family permease
MKNLQGVSINVVILGTVSLLVDISSEMMLPLLPMFILALGGTGLIVGLIGGLGDSIASMLLVLSGYWSDFSGRRKPFVWAGYCLSAVSKMGIAFSTIWQHVFFFRSMERAGKGLRTAPRDAIIAESAARGKAFGIHRAMDTSGAIIGSVLAFLLFWLFGLSFGTIFFIAAIIAFIALAPLPWVKEERKKAMSHSLVIGLKALPASFRWYVIIATIFALGNFTYMFFILRAQQFFQDPRLSVALPVLLYVWFNTTYTAFSIPSGIISDRVGRSNVLIIGYLLFGVTCVGFALPQSLLSLIILFGFYGMFYALVDGTQRAFASDLVTPDLRGTALGTFHTMVGLAALPASIIAGFLWQWVGSYAAFAYGAGAGFLSAGLFIAKRFREKCD